MPGCAAAVGAGRLGVYFVAVAAVTMAVSTVDITAAAVAVAVVSVAVSVAAVPISDGTDPARPPLLALVEVDSADACLASPQYGTAAPTSSLAMASGCDVFVPVFDAVFDDVFDAVCDAARGLTTDRRLLLRSDDGLNIAWARVNTGGSPFKSRLVLADTRATCCCCCGC